MSGLLDVTFPPFCAACGAVLEAPAAFCPGCAAELAELPSPGCGRCSEPGEFDGGTCPRCARRPPAFEAAWAPFTHDGAIARAIHLFKYEDRPELAVPLAALLARHGHAFARGADAIGAVPLHEARYRERRYDQAHLLAAELARRWGLRHLPDALTRTRATRRQVGLDELSREHNVSGAFAASASARGLRLLLVDDVFTTGATARAAAAALLGAGARSVRVLTLARAHSPP